MRDESYDVIAMLAIEPSRVRIWMVPKRICLRQPRQHGRETHWLRFDALDPPDWLGGFLVLDTGGPVAPREPEPEPDPDLRLF
jgi:hypothetical protein